MEKVEQAIQRAQLGENDTVVNLVRQLKQNGHVVETVGDS